MWRHFIVPGLLYGPVMGLIWHLASPAERLGVLIASHVVYLVWLVLWLVPVFKRMFKEWVWKLH